MYREEHKEEISKALSSYTQLQRKHQVGNRRNIYQLCENMVHELLNITENMYDSCQERNKNEIDEK